MNQTLPSNSHEVNSPVVLCFTLVTTPKQPFPSSVKTVYSWDGRRETWSRTNACVAVDAAPSPFTSTTTSPFAFTSTDTRRRRTEPSRARSTSVGTSRGEVTSGTVEYDKANSATSNTSHHVQEVLLTTPSEPCPSAYLSGETQCQQTTLSQNKSISLFFSIAGVLQHILFVKKDSIGIVHWSTLRNWSDPMPH